MDAILDCCCGKIDEEEKKGALVELSNSRHKVDLEIEKEIEEEKRHSELIKSVELTLDDLQRKERQTVYSKPIELSSKDIKEYKIPIYEKSIEDANFLKQSLQNYFLFEELTDDELNVLVNAMERYEVSSATKIVEQDAPEEYCYVVQYGIIDLFCETYQHSVGKVKTGQFFGQQALLYQNCTRIKSAVAEEEEEEEKEEVDGTKVDEEMATAPVCDISKKPGSGKIVLWRVDQKTYRTILARHTDDKLQRIVNILKGIPLFSSMDDKSISKFATLLKPLPPFKKDDLIVKKGEIGNVFYIIEEGEVKVHDIGIGDSQSMDQILTVGNYFGENALLTKEPRMASITVISDTVKTLGMNRDTFDKNMGELKGLIENQLKVQTLKAIPIFATSNIDDDEYSQLANLTKEYCFTKGTKLGEKNKPYRYTIFIIRHGRILVYGDDDTNSSDKIYDLNVGDYYGDKSILIDYMSDELCNHDAICEDNVTAWCLSQHDIENIIGSMSRLGEATKLEKQKEKKSTQLHLDKLIKHRILGKGGFGLVWLVEIKNDDDDDGEKEEKNSSSNNENKAPYALKVINKRRLIDAELSHAAVREKEFLKALEHPFILNCISSFQCNYNLYLVLPLIQGGELFNVVTTAVEKEQRGITNDSMAFYAGCIVEALGHFHHRHIAYRDLKLENIMIDNDGYAIIVDLGFAKVVVDKTYTFCGTPEYLAPEIIMSKGHNHAVDYWALGVIIYEALAAKNPFKGRDMSQMDMFKQIVMVKYNCPDTFNEHVQDLLSKLLTRKAFNRLGMYSQGHIDIRNHPWFETSNITYKELLRKEIKAPWIPIVKNPFDSSNFDDYRKLEEEEKSNEKFLLPLDEDEQKLFEDY